MSLFVKQIASAFFLLVGLIAALSWYEWKDSPFWVLLVGIIFIALGVVGAVLTIQESEEKFD
jgi:membrane protein YdbS with pleckstrin-like domain|tara:strand:+ start:232 stop:417 length:186 start_codon:yes stop_codon:yes gene_type:complete